MKRKRRAGRGPLGDWIAGRAATRVEIVARIERARRKRRGFRLDAREIVRACLVFAVCLLALAVAGRTATQQTSSFALVAQGRGPERLPLLRACAAARWFDKLPGAVRDPNSRCAAAAEVGFASLDAPRGPRDTFARRATRPRLAPQVATSDVVLELVREEDDADQQCTLDVVAAGRCAPAPRAIAF